MTPCNLVDSTIVVEKPDSSNIYLHNKDVNVISSEKLFLVYQITWCHSQTDSNTGVGPEDDKS